MGPINGQTSYMPRMKMSTIHPPKAEEGFSAIIPFNVLVGEPETISCKQLVACGPPHAKQMDGDAEVYLGEVQDRVRLELRVLDKWGNHLTDKRRVCAFIAETYATGYVVDLNWAQVSSFTATQMITLTYCSVYHQGHNVLVFSATF